MPYSTEETTPVSEYTLEAHAKTKRHGTEPTNSKQGFDGTSFPAKQDRKRRVKNLELYRSRTGMLLEGPFGPFELEGTPVYPESVSRLPDQRLIPAKSSYETN
jgi:hypothetical protein